MVEKKDPIKVKPFVQSLRYDQIVEANLRFRNDDASQNEDQLSDDEYSYGKHLKSEFRSEEAENDIESDETTQQNRKYSKYYLLKQLNHSYYILFPFNPEISVII